MWASCIDPMSTCKTYLDYIRSGKIPSMILELPCTSRLELASGVVTCQRKHRSSITRKLLETSATDWQCSRRNDVEAVNQLFGTNEVEIKQKSLEALRLFRQADQALDKICKFIADFTECV